MISPQRVYRLVIIMARMAVGCMATKKIRIWTERHVQMRKPPTSHLGQIKDSSFYVLPRSGIELTTSRTLYLQTWSRCTTPSATAAVHINMSYMTEILIILELECEEHEPGKTGWCEERWHRYMDGLSRWDPNVNVTFIERGMFFSN